MDDQNRYRRNRGDEPPSEGVRIIGPDEAAEVAEREDVAPRRGEGEPRYGDRPEAPPEGPRPSLRFPLDATADPSRIERPPVEPAPDPVTGPVELPHWTEPATGEVPPAIIGDRGPLLDDDDEDDLEGWSTFSTAPRWRDAGDDWSDDDDFVTGLSREVRIVDGPEVDEDDGWGDDWEDDSPTVGHRSDLTEAWDEDGDDDWSASSEGDRWSEPASGQMPAADDEAEEGSEDEGPSVEDGDDSGPTGDRNDSRRVQIGEERYSDSVPVYTDATDVADDSGDRHLPTAIGVGVGLAAMALIAMAIDARAMVVVVAAILGYAAYEFFTQLGKAEWETASLLGIVACVALPLAAYWRGAAAYPLLMFVILAATLSWYLAGAGGRDPRVLEGTGATLFGVVWIGVLGSTAAAMLSVSHGTGLLIAAILATVAYDVGGLFIGRYMGQRPLSAASPNKTVEGLVGGMGLALVVTVITIGVLESGPWTGPGAAIVLGLGAACAAPLGDLCQSLLKRDLRIKDMGSILPGHGGVLDRFDSMLFVLPTVFWLTWAFNLT